ncbi:MAG: GNAT family N-acetyltransferase [bacterium]
MEKGERVKPSRVRLRKLRRADFSAFIPAWNDPEIMRLTTERQFQLTSQEVFAKLEEHLTNPKMHDFVILVDGEIAGHIVVQLKPHHRRYEIYIAIHDKDFWGRGVGTIATLKACDWFFRMFPDEFELELGVFTLNTRAIRCYEKCGFKRVRVMKRSFCPDELIMRKVRETG